MVVFQSVLVSSNRHCRRPPFEIVVQGRLVPGMEATRHPCGKGTWQGRPVSPFSIVKLQDSSVVAVESSESCAPTSEDITTPDIRSEMNRANLHHGEIIDVGS